jgi:LPPG:FO 2-phospho-L-lactate transferase
MKITALAGGVGGAKLARGFSLALPPGNLSVIVNTADDFWYQGLFISPDIDTVIYNLSGINQPQQGWGRNCETYNFLDEMNLLGEPTWFQLGDRDLATHILRTALIHQQKPLTDITDILRRKRHIASQILPMTDQKVSTVIETIELGPLAFQEYFVKHKFQPKVKSINFSGIELAVMTDAVKQSIDSSDLIVICPSNPFVSIAPILSVAGMKAMIRKKPVIAVSPLVGGKAIKGPAAKMFTELGFMPSSYRIGEYYNDILDGLVIDNQDLTEKNEIERCGIILLVTDTIMDDDEKKLKLAHEVIDFGKKVIEAKKV